MSEALAEVVADIDDPRTVAKVLEAAGADIEQPSESSTRQDLSTLFERYLSRRSNRSPSTVAQYKRTIPDFVEFAEEESATTTADLSTEVIDAYVDELQSKYDADSTILTHTKNVRAWLRWLNRRDLCDESVYRILDKEELGLSPQARDEAIPESEATAILANLRERRRGSRLHALMALLWIAGPRIGGVHSLDVSDFDPENREIRFRHRPETATRLKNGDEDDGTTGDGERNVELNQEAIEAIALYLETSRPDVTDEYGREPLFATEHGRACRTTLRRWVYRATSCRWASNDEQEVECTGDCDPDSDICSYSYYPHAIRRGVIVNHLSGGLRPDIASERFDVSVKTIRKHYDPRTKRQRKDDRAEAVRSCWVN